MYEQILPNFASKFIAKVTRKKTEIVLEQNYSSIRQSLYYLSWEQFYFFLDIYNMFAFKPLASYKT